MAVAGAIIGEVPADILAWINGKDRPDPWTIARFVDNASTAYGFGMVQDTIHAFNRGGPGDAALSLAPPALSDVYRFGSATVEAAKGKPKSLASEAVGQIPIVGTRARRIVKPPKKKKAAAEIQFY
jgi:hypothetical protein